MMKTSQPKTSCNTSVSGPAGSVSARMAPMPRAIPTSPLATPARTPSRLISGISVAIIMKSATAAGFFIPKRRSWPPATSPRRVRTIPPTPPGCSRGAHHECAGKFVPIYHHQRTRHPLLSRRDTLRRFVHRAYTISQLRHQAELIE